MLENFKLNLQQECNNNFINSELLKNVLINTAGSYFLAKGYTVKVVKKDNWLYLDDVIISLNNIIDLKTSM